MDHSFLSSGSYRLKWITKGDQIEFYSYEEIPTDHTRQETEARQ
jgi:hypothetical protein